MSNKHSLDSHCVIVPADPISLHEEEIPSPWVSTNGAIAHPDSPDGAGGAGHFRIPGTIDGKGKQSFTLPSPATRDGRSHVLSADEETALQKSKTPQKKKQPPPVTTPQSFNRKIKTNKHNVKVDLTFKILNDLTNQTHLKEGTAATGPVQDTATAGFEWAEAITDEAKTKVTQINGTHVLNGVVELQILYGPKTKPEDTVGYGRGTTDQDKIDGNITIGFHEHCHLNDWWNYLKTESLTLNFEGKVDMTTTEYEEKQKLLEDAFQKFLNDADLLTAKQTDETGKPPKSEFKSNR